MTWFVANRIAVILRRVAEASIAAFLLLALSPLFVAVLVMARIYGGGIRKKERLGRWATHFNQYRFEFAAGSVAARFSALEQIPVLYNIFRGDMSFVGPRPISPVEELTEKRIAWKRYDTRPGLLSLWWIRKRANIAYSSEMSLDLEYVETKSLWGDVGIAARAIPAAFLATGVSSAPRQIQFLGVQIDNLTMAEASAQIVTFAQASEPMQVCFVNADCVNIAYKNKAYRSTLDHADLVLADGIGVRVAASMLDQNVRENVNGTDMLPYLCVEAERSGVGIYLLGGKADVPERAAAWMKEHYPGLVISGTSHGYFSQEEEAQVIQNVKDSGAGILLVALGAPRQDLWISEHVDALGVKVAIGVGGLLDFYSGNIPRAPVWVRELGMEWFYRFAQEPRRMWRRYFVGNTVFLYRVIRERMRARTALNAEGNVQ